MSQLVHKQSYVYHKRAKEVEQILSVTLNFRRRRMERELTGRGLWQNSNAVWWGADAGPPNGKKQRIHSSLPLTFPR